MPSDVVENTNCTIKEEIYNTLISNRLFPEKQKRCRKETRVTGELIYINQNLLTESKTKQKNSAIALSDYKKACDMVHHSWIIHCLKIYKIFDEVINLSRKPGKTVEREEKL